MATYVAHGRTNTFQVHDVEALRQDLIRHGVEVGTWGEPSDLVMSPGNPGDPEGSVALFSYGPWPGMDADSIMMRLGLDDDGLDDDGLDEGDCCGTSHESIADLIAGHLVEDCVAVFVEIGQEKMRYLNGHALAVNSAGETQHLDLDQIYTMAETHLRADGDTKPIPRAHY